MVLTWFFWSLTTVILILRQVAAIAFVNRLRPSECLMIAAYVGSCFSSSLPININFVNVSAVLKLESHAQ
jgi:hypothetical protein